MLSWLETICCEQPQATLWLLTVYTCIQYWTIWQLQCFSTASAYRAFFIGQTEIRGARCLKKARAPGKCKFFIWLVLHGRCWTAERRKRHNLQDDDTCILCSQESESITHLLLNCSFARECSWSCVTFTGTHSHQMVAALISRIGGPHLVRVWPRRIANALILWPSSPHGWSGMSAIEGHLTVVQKQWASSCLVLKTKPLLGCLHVLGTLVRSQRRAGVLLVA